MRRTTWWCLAGVAVVAFGTRAAYVLAFPPALFSGADNSWYNATAGSLAAGHWGRVPGLFSHQAFSIKFPLGYPAVLAVGQRLLFWMHPYGAHLWTSVLLGTVGAVLVGAVAWRLTDVAPYRVRLLAMCTAGLLFALNPIIVGESASLMSEALYVPVICGVLLLLDIVTSGHGTSWTWVLLGATIALGALTRSEGLILLGVPLLALQFVPGTPRNLRRVSLKAVSLAAIVVVVWSVGISFLAARPVFVSANSGSLLLGANCPYSLYGSGRGLWDVRCLGEVPANRLSEKARVAEAAKPASPFGLALQWGPALEAEVNSAQLRETGSRVVGDPIPSLEAVPFRWARAIGVYWTVAEQHLTEFEGRDMYWEGVGRIFEVAVVLPLVALTVLAVVLKRSRLGAVLRSTVTLKRLVPSALLVGTWVVLTALTQGSARVRAPIEPVLAILAGLGLAATWRTLVSGNSDRAGDDDLVRTSAGNGAATDQTSS